MDQGDCDSNSECQGNLYCGYKNCPSLNLVLHGVMLNNGSEVDCCTNNQLVSPNYPNFYLSGVNETWLFTAAANRTQFIVQFHDFVLYDSHHVSM